MTTRITLWRTLFGEHPQVLLENCDFKARIPMKGQTGSLNAAVAAAVLMYEKVRQESVK